MARATLQTALSLLLTVGFLAETQSQIVVDSSNPAWLSRIDANGDRVPFFMSGPGDPEGFLYRGTRLGDGTRGGAGADQVALINKLAPTGANSIYMQMVRSNGGDGAADENPFLDPSNPNSGLNNAVLDQWDTWLTSMDDAGIVSYLFFYDDGASPFGGFNRDISNGTAEEQFVTDIVNRYEHLDHLIWVVAEEYSEAHSVSDVSRLAEIIKAADDRSHVVGVHQLNGVQFDFSNDPNIDHFSAQRNMAGAGNIHDEMVQAVTNANGAYNVAMAESSSHYNATNPDRQATREYSWAAAMAGTYISVLRMDIAGTPIEILEDHGRMVEFFEQTNFNIMTTHDELALAETDYVLANPGADYIAYSASLSSNMGVSGILPGRYDLLWFDTVSGTTVSETGVIVSGSDATFVKPGSLGGEIALWITTTTVPEPSTFLFSALTLVGMLLIRRRRARLRRAPMNTLHRHGYANG